jgi:hypothetical protein
VVPVARTVTARREAKRHEIFEQAAHLEKEAIAGSSNLVYGPRRQDANPAGQDRGDFDNPGFAPYLSRFRSPSFPARIAR